MRRPTSAFAKAVLGTALAATTVSAQQSPPSPPQGDPAAAPVPPLNAARGARYLLRNGWDYITYQEYERSLAFFREAESRQYELNDAERLRLKQGIDRAQRGLREATNGLNREPAYARSGQNRRPGALALAKPPASATDPNPNPNANPGPAIEREPIQLVGGGSNVAVNPSPAVATATTTTTVNPPASSPEPVAVPAPHLSPPPIPPPPDFDAPALPAAEPVPAPAPTPSPAAVDPASRPLAPPAEVALPAPAPTPAPAPEQAPAPAPEPGPAARAPLAVALAAPDLPPPPEDITLPTLPGEPAPAPAAAPMPMPMPLSPPVPAGELPPPVANAAALRAPEPTADPGLGEASLPPLPSNPAGEAPPPAARPAVEPPPAPAAESLTLPMPAPAPAPAVESPPIPALAPAPAPADEPPAVNREMVPDSVPPLLSGAADRGMPRDGASPAAEPVEMPRPGADRSAPSPDEPAPPPLSTTPPRGRFGIDTLVPERSETYTSTLPPELQREVDQIAARQDEEMRRNPLPAPNNPDAPAEAPTAPGGPTSTRLEISRAPSPTEARPIRAIPVPEEFTPLPKRDWNPNRKLWSAAATCHLPLYFQDASLERYGYSVEQHFGPFGRFLSIPIDDPRQSKQRNQIAQPFFSMGLFAAQIALLPYNMIMDPPWESEYDLGYYRPGDRVPTDVFYLPLTGIGPPLKGKNYAVPANSSNGAPLPIHRTW